MSATGGRGGSNLAGAGGKKGSGGAGAIGGASGFGGTAGKAAGGGAGSSPAAEWADWQMPNCPVDVAAGAPNPPNYTDNGDGTVSDLVTGLHWQQTVPNMSYSLPQAQAYCASLNLGNLTGWRVPTIIELYSIVDPTKVVPALDPIFGKVPDTLGIGNGETLSTSPFRDPSSVRDVIFDDSRENYDPAAASGPDYLVRCVWKPAKPPLLAHYAISKDTVYDNGTHLTWERNASGTIYDFPGATAHCASLSLGGMAGWRVPTEKELLTLVDPTRSDGASIDPVAFPSTLTFELYWTATPPHNSTAGTVGWAMNFDQGFMFLNGDPHFVRCVATGGAPAADGGVGGTGGDAGSAAGTGGANGGGGHVGSNGGAPGPGPLDWAQWPMPNGAVDVAAGAPNLDAYTDNGDGTVTDNVTGLMWQQTVPLLELTWADALSYCTTLAVGGHSDWRLPTEIELISLLDYSTSPTINAVFTRSPTTTFWSSTLLVNSDSSYAWWVDLMIGQVSNADVMGFPPTNAARCVR
jgi:Protein of unknown function (DUF1566)